MYIINDDTHEELESITLLLTRREIRYLASYSKQLLESPQTIDHVHLTDDDYEKEMIICLYDELDVTSLDPRIQKIIKNWK